MDLSKPNFAVRLREKTRKSGEAGFTIKRIENGEWVFTMKGWKGKKVVDETCERGGSGFL